MQSDHTFTIVFTPSSLFLADFGASALALLRAAVDRRASMAEASSSAAAAPASASDSPTGPQGVEVDHPDLALIRGCCNALSLLVTADDDRPAGSAAFKNARVLAKVRGDPTPHSIL